MRVSGRGASNTSGSGTVRSRGLYSSENAAMSSEKYVRIILAERLRFQKEGSSASG